MNYSSRHISPVFAALFVLALLFVGSLAFALLSGSQREVPNNSVISGVKPSVTATLAEKGDVVFSISYETDTQDVITESLVDSPLRIYVQLPSRLISSKTIISAVHAQLLDLAGNLAQFGDATGEPINLNPTYNAGVWAANISVPSKPGIYYAHLDIVSHASSSLTATMQTESADLKQPLFEARLDPGPPLTRGYVFARDYNLWLLSGDLSKEKKLTFFSPHFEAAESPVWSPDGKSIAFAFVPRSDPSQLPTTEIWEVTPGSGAAHRLVAKSDTESLSDPAYSSDGKYLYFTVETLGSDSSLLDANGLPVNANRIDRIELASGARSVWLKAGQDPASGGSDGAMLYVAPVDRPAKQKGLQAGVQLIRRAEEGSDQTILVDQAGFPNIYAPRISPDGKWVAFASVSFPVGSGTGGGRDENAGVTDKPAGDDLVTQFFRWLLFTPAPAQAHGVPWDLYLVPKAGGTPSQLTHLSEDQPVAAWLDNNTIMMMGTTGLYKLEIDANGKVAGKPMKLADGAAHGGLSWYAP